MVFRSLRWRLSLSYIGLVICTTLLFGGLLLTGLRLYYSERERQYLDENGNLLGQQLADLLSKGYPPSALEEYIFLYANAMQTRIKIYDQQDDLLLDSNTLASAPQTGPENQDAFPSPVPPLTGDLPTSIPDGSTSIDVEIKIISFAPGQPGDPGLHSDQTVSISLENPATGEKLGRLDLSEGPAYGAQILSGLIQVGAWVGVGSILLAGILGWSIGRKLATPLSKLSAAAGQMASGDLSVRVEMPQSDEIGVLAASFNHMAERVQKTVTVLRDFTADAAHELYTPLTALLTDLDIALQTANAEMDTLLRDARSQTRNLIEMTDGLLDLSRLETQAEPVLHSTNLTDTLNQMVEVYASRAEQAGLNLDLKSAGTRIMIQGDPLQIRRAVQNVLDNAVKFATLGSTIHVELRRNGDWYEIEVINSGIEIPLDDLPKIFDRFYRGRNTSSYKGGGLGLAIVKAIMNKHHGEVLVRNASQGTSFILRWLACEEENHA